MDEVIGEPRKMQAFEVAFEKGLIIERCGPIDQVIKFLPALTIDHDTLNQGLEIV